MIDDDEATEERDEECRALVRRWLVSEGWPRIAGELLLLVTSPTGRRKRIVRLRPTPGGVTVHSKVGTLRWTLGPLASDSSNYRLPPGALAQMVKVMPPEAGKPRFRRKSHA